MTWGPNQMLLAIIVGTGFVPFVISGVVEFRRFMLTGPERWTTDPLVGFGFWLWSVVSFVGIALLLYWIPQVPELWELVQQLP